MFPLIFMGKIYLINELIGLPGLPRNLLYSQSNVLLHLHYVWCAKTEIAIFFFSFINLFLFVHFFIRRWKLKLTSGTAPVIGTQIYPEHVLTYPGTPTLKFQKMPHYIQSVAKHQAAPSTLKTCLLISYKEHVSCIDEVHNKLMNWQG